MELFRSFSQDDMIEYSNKAIRDSEKTRDQLIAELKEMRHELQEKKSQGNHRSGDIDSDKEILESAMNCVGDMIIVTDNEGRIRKFNKAFLQFTGKSGADLVGKDWEPAINECNLSIVTFYAGSIEFIHNPSKRWFILNSYTFNDSALGQSGTVITIHETTEVKQVSEELENTNKIIEKNRKGLQNALDEISKLIQNVTSCSDTSIRLINPNMKVCHEVHNCENKDCECYGKEAMRCWQIAGTFCGGDVQGHFAQKYGSCSQCEVYRNATADPIYQIGEQFNNMMYVLESKNKELESAYNEMQTAFDEALVLAQELEIKNKESDKNKSQLEEAYNELKNTQARILQQEKMASIGQLAAGVAHEINNPTGFIKSNLGTLGKYASRLTEFIFLQNEALESLNVPEITGELDEQRKKMKLDYIFEDMGQLLEESLDGAERIKKIVQNLKSFARVDESDHKRADINECIESTLNIAWNELKYKTTVEKEYGELPPAKCYPQQLNQVFMNLLVNAAQAIEKQGVVRIKTWNGDGSINISISDTGAGIPEDKLNRIFEPFFTTKDVGKGTGLGLSISYDIIKKHNGEITVESEVGKGTVFTIKIPGGQ